MSKPVIFIDTGPNIKKKEFDGHVFLLYIFKIKLFS